MTHGQISSQTEKATNRGGNPTKKDFEKFMLLGMDGVDLKRTTIVIFGRLIVMVLTINRNKGRISLVRVSNTPNSHGDSPCGCDRRLAVKWRKKARREEREKD